MSASTCCITGCRQPASVWFAADDRTLTINQLTDPRFDPDLICPVDLVCQSHAIQATSKTLDAWVLPADTATSKAAARVYWIRCDVCGFENEYQSAMDSIDAYRAHKHKSRLFGGCRWSSHG
ncbi:MAG: hypothetical protein WCI74_07425 [Actinomycetes bacterium]